MHSGLGLTKISRQRRGTGERYSQRTQPPHIHQKTHGGYTEEAFRYTTYMRQPKDIIEMPPGDPATSKLQSDSRYLNTTHLLNLTHSRSTRVHARARTHTAFPLSCAEQRQGLHSQQHLPTFHREAHDAHGFTHTLFFFFGKGKGLNLQESNPSDTEDVTECAGKKGRHTERHRHLYASPPALTAGLGRASSRGWSRSTDLQSASVLP